MITEDFAKILQELAEKHIPSNYPCIKKRNKAKADQLKLIKDISDFAVYVLDKLNVKIVLEGGTGKKADIKGIGHE